MSKILKEEPQGYEWRYRPRLSTPDRNEWRGAKNITPMLESETG